MWSYHLFQDGWVGFDTVIHRKKRQRAEDFRQNLQKETRTSVFQSVDNKLKNFGNQ